MCPVVDTKSEKAKKSTLQDGEKAPREESSAPVVTEPTSFSEDPSDPHTPAFFRMEKSAFSFDEEALEALEWRKITRYLSSLCRTSWGHLQAEHLPFYATRAAIQREYKQIEEGLFLLQEYAEEIPVGNIPEMSAALLRLEKGGHLEGADLLEIARALQVTSEVRNFLESYKDEAPALWERGELLSPLTKLRREIERAIDEHGQLREDASWELGALRSEVRACHERLRRKLQDYLSSAQSKYLTDTYYTLREDRYVLPVKVSERGRFPGIVYGSSGSGATIYIEPQPLVELNNALRMAENDVAQEELRILMQLSAQVGTELQTFLSNLEILRDIDLVQAKIRFAERLDGTVPELAPAEEGGVFVLKQARHPLLVLKGVDVVANDIMLGERARCLIISGPNTGGKTVNLKTMGLCSLMARAALPIPAREGSQVPLFREIFTDIGDQQSIEQDLSTFSAQIVKIRQILERANRSTLVLIDEIIVGTDPQQGAVLAAAILQSLRATDAFVAVTTHYEYLKALPYEDAGFENASVGFDLQTLSPTYRLYLGTPGTSSALDIARRLGLSEAVCKRAESMLSASTDRFETLVARLEQQYAELYEERDRAERARKKLERELLEVQQKQEKLDRTRERVLAGEEDAMRKELREARDSLREMIHHLQKKQGSWEEIQKSERLIKEAEERARKAIQKSRPKAPEPMPIHHLKPGAKVYVPSMKAQAEVLEAPNAQGEVALQIGTLRMRVSASTLRPPQSAAKVQVGQAKSPTPARRARRSATIYEAPMEGEDSSRFVAVQTSSNTCDMRGMRVEEALEMAESFLDKAYKEEMGAAYLIHGHGTGALREAIRSFCRTSSYVISFRPGDGEEGGNGVTVVQLSP
ncbi:MAG: endonuclease MutS2 [Myxococcales bacterium]|nr:endonuclease MutS2 [Myxococcales bacterium]MCB9643824.1 endonuclease MutS2 [Myxococcales bacterium]